MDIYSNFRERTRFLETFVHFIRGKEARRGLERKLGEGKNLEKTLIIIFFSTPFSISDYLIKCF